MATFNVLYPSGPDFDLDYYLYKHFPIVEENWKPLGLKSWEVIKCGPGQKYQIQAILRWDSLESVTKATAPGGEAAAKVFADIPNFTAAKPDVVFGGKTGEKSVL